MLCVCVCVSVREVVYVVFVAEVFMSCMFVVGATVVFSKKKKNITSHSEPHYVSSKSHCRATSSH